MFNHRWETSGSLNQICEQLHSLHFSLKIFLMVSRGEGWYQIDGNTWLMVKVAEGNWQLYLWQNYDPRPFIRTITKLKGFK